MYFYPLWLTLYGLYLQVMLTWTCRGGISVSRFPLSINAASVIISVQRYHFVRLAHLLPQRACLSLSPPLFLILSLSYGGRDENGCLIMQRGQPIKGPGPSDLRAYSEHSWRERERSGREEEREEREIGWGLIAVWRGSPLIHLPPVSFHQ